MTLSVNRYHYDQGVGQYDQQITALVKRGRGLQTILILDKPLDENLSNLTQELLRFIQFPENRFSNFSFVKENNNLSFQVNVQSHKDNQVIGDYILIAGDGIIFHSRGRAYAQIFKVFQIVHIEVEKYHVQKRSGELHVHILFHFVVSPDVNRTLTILGPYDWKEQNYLMIVETVSKYIWQERQSAL